VAAVSLKKKEAQRRDRASTRSAGRAGVGRAGWRGHVFFFQAEDGIRDRDVTGVQTCALPIFNMIIISRCFYLNYM